MNYGTIEGCWGCYTRDMCKRAKHDESLNCPCKMCLIKSMCNTPCEEYKKFWGLEHDFY